jgi:pentatricopeptide repeat protein
MLQSMLADNMHPSSTSFDYVIDVLQVAGKWKQLLQLFGLMQQHGVKPTGMSYSCCIIALAQAEKWNELLKVFRNMQKDCTEWFDIDTLNVALLACLKTGDTKSGLEIADWIGAEQSNDATKALTAQLQQLQQTQADASASEQQQEQQQQQKSPQASP